MTKETKYLIASIAMSVIVIITVIIVNVNTKPAKAGERTMSISEELNLTPNKKGTRVYEEVTVKYGDSLWKIAEQYLDRTYHTNARDFVNQLVSVNNITSENLVQMGQVIIVPCYNWE